jgi:glucose-6-phosphate isomerase
MKSFEYFEHTDFLDIEKLIEEARVSKVRRSRINLHQSLQSGAQKMLIALFYDSVIQTHRHPNAKSETYFPIIGSLKVEYGIGKEVHEMIFNSAENAIQDFNIVTHGGGIWHKPTALGEFCVYLEIYDGPFNKEFDVEIFPRLIQ